MSPKLVLGFILAIFVVILGVDVWLYADEIARNSISQVIIDLSKKSPLVPWFAGLVMGFLAAHWFDTYTQEK